MTALTTGHKIVLGITTSFPGTIFILWQFCQWFCSYKTWITIFSSNYCCFLTILLGSSNSSFAFSSGFASSFLTAFSASMCYLIPKQLLHVLSFVKAACHFGYPCLFYCIVNHSHRKLAKRKQTFMCWTWVCGLTRQFWLELAHRALESLGWPPLDA